MNVETVFENEGKIPKKYTADGEDINPPFTISSFPKETESLVLICDDPDAEKVAGFTWIHWIVYNIPVTSEKIVIKENSVPGTQLINSFKIQDYGGPSPPKGSGVHNYHFKFFALNKILTLLEDAGINELKKSIKESVIDKAEIVGTYTRD